ncbi:MAG: hypothetical protein CMC76_01090 [Flavobacteriaceae bacterium]|uniref:hypothetical protein n=1 Tax=Winogradskyella sp. SYSU M77433 TaxID=3042722 RepID=UPI000C5E8BA4|nr:hypothetical protein [Winogradskyella sp. SYSU M77433]MAX69689.1 hypothetical protein [Flavobacteriaceae bacterium]MDH7913616.1 hypothetical protein [Winogradskyella sp. SYSU M77433]|tara:strand:+ start:5527 stop:5742 length:216 start_codon:yes stop_codon:yes gene_type:complete
MKIQLDKNQSSISSIRSQITKSDDLKKFDEFLAKNDSFDFNDESAVSAARACCGGDECCHIVINVPTLDFK